MRDLSLGASLEDREIWTRLILDASEEMRRDDKTVIEAIRNLKEKLKSTFRGPVVDRFSEFLEQFEYIDPNELLALEFRSALAKEFSKAGARELADVDREIAKILDEDPPVA